MKHAKNKRKHAHTYTNKQTNTKKILVEEFLMLFDCEQ